MKKYILAVTLAILSQAILKGQDTDIENNAEVRAQIESIFENIDKSKIQTGLLRDYSTDLVDYSVFDGTLNESNIADLGTYEYILRSVRTSSVTSSYPFGSVTDIMDGMAEATTSSSIPISILAYKYNYVVDNAITDGLFQRIGDQVYDVYDENQNWVNPYQESYVISFAPSVEAYKAGSYTFTVGSFTFTNLSISSIELDAGDGLGYRSLSSGLTVYLSGGSTVLKLKLTLQDGVVLYAHTQIEVQKLSVNPQGGNSITPDLTKSFTQSVSGETISATASVKYAAGHTSFVKPFIVVEGFDPVEFGDTDVNSPYYGKGSTNLSTLFSYLTPNIAENYDIVYVDWNNCEASIEDNAKLLIKIINWVNSQNTSHSGNVIMGQSMGGLITRYALCEMESNNVSHKVKTFVSHDVPYLGVNIPIGAQYAVTDLIKNVYNRYPWINEMLNLNTSGSYVNLAEKYLHSTSARQMLLTYIDKDGNLDNSVHQNWQSKLKSIGFPKGDADIPTKNIAIANGGQNDFRTNKLASFYGYSTNRVVCILISAFFGNFGAIFNSIFLGKYSNITIDLDILPYDNTGCKVYAASVKYRKNIKWLNSRVSNTLYSRTKYAPNWTSNFGYDIANGSYYKTSNLSLDEISCPISIFDSTSFSVANRILLVPTASALCIGKDKRALTAQDFRAMYTSGRNYDSPFINVYVDNNGKCSEHIELDTLMCNWIYNNLECKLEGAICPKENERYAVYNYTGSVNWSTSDENIATVDARGRIHIKKSGFVTIIADYTGIRDTIRAMTGIPKFTLTSAKDIGGEGCNVVAHCEDREILDFITRTNFKVSWGVKYGSKDIVWQDDELGILIDKCSYKTFVSTGLNDAYAYFKPYNDTFIGDVSMVYCSRVPVKRPIDDTFIILGNGSLLASGEDASVETKSEVPESVIIYKIGDVEELTFCHVPTAAEFCKRMVASEKIRELLKEMKPWGESESIIIPVVISAGEEVYEGTFKCVYKKSL